MSWYLAIVSPDPLDLGYILFLCPCHVLVIVLVIVVHRVCHLVSLHANFCLPVDHPVCHPSDFFSDLNHSPYDSQIDSPDENSVPP
jgi:hypothetical protein